MKKHEKRNKITSYYGKADGSATVETALVMPVVLGVIVFLLCMGFFVHDRIVLEGAAMEAAVRMTVYEKIPHMKQEMSGEEITQEILRNKLFLTDGADADVSSGAKKACVRLDSRIRLPAVPTLRQVFPGRTFTCAASCTMSVPMQEDIMRKTESIKALMNKEGSDAAGD